MKLAIQCVIFLFITIFCLSFYKTYFNDDNEIIQAKNKKEDIKNDDIIADNLIKNLQYNINLFEKGEYSIISEFSEIIYKNNNEVVNMQNVEAKFVNAKGLALIITSEKAIYDTNFHNTKFSKNVKIKYVTELITSEKLEINFKKNLILIEDNIFYKGDRFQLNADIAKINMITNKIDIFMKRPDQKIKIYEKR